MKTHQKCSSMYLFYYEFKLMYFEKSTPSLITNLNFSTHQDRAIK